MRKIVLSILTMLLVQVSFGQLTGSYTIPGAPYATIASAISALNTQGAGIGGVTFNVTAGYTETFASPTAGLITTTTGSAANPIVFQKSGAGANPLITAGTPGTGTMDYVFCILGTDYITFDGINTQENAANTTTTQQMEWGYAVLKASATDGSQNVTIKNCSISLNKSNTATYAIYSNNHTNLSTTQLTVTAASGGNSNNKFFGLTMSNVYHGIYLYGFADGTVPYLYYDQGNEIGKDGANTLTSYGGGTATSYGIYSLYQNNLKIANTSFLGTITSTTGACYGIYMSTMVNSNLDIYNNTVTLTYNGTGAFYAMYSLAGASGTSNTTNIYNNTVTGCTAPNATSGTWYGIYMYGGMTANFYNNSVTNNTYGSGTATATGSIYGIYHYSSPTAAGTMNVYGNTVANNSRVQSAIGTGTGYHFYLSGGNGTMNAYNNIVNNLTIGSSSTQYITYILHSGAKNFYNNTITNILNSNGGTLYSIYNGNGTGNALFYNNKIQNINGNVAGSIVYGFYQSSGANVYLYNNYISELKTPLATGIPAIYGIYFSGGTTLGAYNNTIYLNATSSGANFGVTGIYASTTPTVDLRNNIVVNNSTPNGTGRVVAYQRSSTTLTTYANTSNNNDFWAGTPGASRLIYYDGTNSDQTISAYKSRVAPKDGNSVTENAPFVNVAASPYDLHLQTTVPTQCESGGATVSTPVVITTDYDGQNRFPNAGFPVGGFTPFAPDLGADEFGGLFLDVNPPNIVFTPLMNTSSTSARTLTTTIADPSGVPTTGIGLPRLFWKVFYNGSWQPAVTGTYISGSTYTFTFGGGVVLNDSVYYYIVAQDGFTPINIGSNPSNGSGYSANPPTCSSPPPNASLYKYKIVSTICGTFNVGAGQAYTTLTAAVADLNNKEMTCAVTFLLTDPTYSASETFPIIINANPGSSAVNTLTIKPSTGVTATITGALNSAAILRVLNPNTIIDGSNAAGGTTRDLTIANTSVTSPSVVLIGSTGTTPITNTTLKNCIVINGANTATAVIVSDGATSGTAGYFNNITIQNNSIQLAYIGIYNIAMTAAGNGSGLLIAGNNLSTSGANSIRLCAIYVQGVDGATVTNNTIGNMANTVDAANLTGIWFATGTINSTISGNTITGISSTTTGPRGLALSSGVANANLMISDNTISGFTTSMSQATYGIYFFSTTSGCMIQRNRIYDIKNTASGGYSAIGIALGSTLTAANTTVQNNLMYDIAGYGYSSMTTDNGYGMNILSGGGYNLYHNTVRLSTDQTIATGNPACLIINSTVSANSLDIRDNIFYIDATMGTNRFAVLCNATNTVFSSLDYNDYYSTGPNLGYLGANILDLAAWKVATGKDVNSQSINPVFVSLTDQHPTAVTLDNLGVYLNTVPTDYSLATRYNPADIGAYEFGSTPVAWVATLAATGITSTGATINGNGSGNGSTVTTSFEYGLTTGYGSTMAATPGSISGIPTAAFSANLGSLPYNTLYHYRAKGQIGTGTPFYGTDMTFTTLAVPPTVITGSATGITTTGATLNGQVNANNASTTVIFEYGLTAAYGSTIAATPGTVTGGAFNPVSATIGGLLPYTTYHYRVQGTNVAGTANGGDSTFTTLATPATVITNPASNILVTSAQLNGNVNANGFSTTVSFEWGLTAAYGNSIAAIPGTVTGSVAIDVLANLGGLLTNTTYHYRCVGTSVGGTIYGLDQSFLTGCPPVGPAGPITGSTSLCAGSTGQVYSIAPIVNATGYAWTAPAGATITAGQGTTSITVTFGTTSGNVSVYGTGPCGNGAPNSLAVTVNPLPVPTITGPATACQGTTNSVYTTQASMTGYNWTVSAGGMITAGTGTNAITVTWNTAGAQSVGVTYTNGNGCTAASPGTYNVTVNAAPVPVITGPTSMCVNSGFYNYSTQGGFTNYVWTISGGGMITFGQGTNQIQVSWAGPGAQWVAVNYTNSFGCFAQTPTSLAVTVDPVPSTAGTITGTAAVCGGATGVAYSCAPIVNATTYVWTLPAGATITAGSGTNSILVDFAANASSGNITVYGNNLCGNGAVSPDFPVTVTALPDPAGVITGQTAVCQGTSGVIYTVPLIANATSYLWTVPSGATIVAGQTTATITVDFGLTAVSGNVTVYGSNSCGNGGSSALPVTVNPIPATPVITLNLDILSSSAATGNQWYYEGSLIPGATAQTYQATQSGWYWDVVTLYGCSSDTSNNIYVLILGTDDPLKGIVNIYPVPNDGLFTVALVSTSAQTFRITVLNNLGVVIREMPALEVKGTLQQVIDLRPVPNGIYTVIIQNSDNRMIRKIVVNK
jgi:hypothetical protein